MSTLEVDDLTVIWENELTQEQWHQMALYENTRAIIDGYKEHKTLYHPNMFCEYEMESQRRCRRRKGHVGPHAAIKMEFIPQNSKPFRVQFQVISYRSQGDLL